MTVAVNPANITVTWPSPWLLPHYYRLQHDCTLLCEQTAYSTQSLKLSRNETSQTFISCLPGSICNTILLAVYNMVGLDSGLTSTDITPTKSELLFTTLYFMMYVYVYRVLIDKWRIHVYPCTTRCIINLDRLSLYVKKDTNDVNLYMHILVKQVLKCSKGLPMWR